MYVFCHMQVENLLKGPAIIGNNKNIVKLMIHDCDVTQTHNHLVCKENTVSQEHTVKCTKQISTHNTAQLFDQFG